jgi:carnosine N-methyltransferase
MRSTIKSFMREWSSEGAQERLTCYQPIIDEVTGYFTEQGRPVIDAVTGQRLSVLHPGCGLGRLVFEFAVRGYKSQGNEFAYFMLLSSNFILNAS